MSWYDDNFRRRAAITVHNSAGAASGDIDVTIPSDWDEFWGVIDSSGNELRVTEADGRTLVTYDVDKPGGGAFSLPGKSGRIRIDGATLTATANTTTLFWVYFDTESTAGDASSAVTMSSILDGYIELGRPARRPIVVQQQPPGLTRPVSIDAKSSTAAEHYWLDVSQILEQYRRTVEGRLCYEEISAVLVSSVQDDGTTAASLETHSATRFVEIVRGRDRRMLVRIKLSGGTDGERYTAGLTISTRTPASTSVHRTLTHRFGLVVVNAVEPAA